MILISDSNKDKSKEKNVHHELDYSPPRHSKVCSLNIVEYSFAFCDRNAFRKGNSVQLIHFIGNVKGSEKTNAVHRAKMCIQLKPVSRQTPAARHQHEKSSRT